MSPPDFARPYESEPQHNDFLQSIELAITLPNAASPVNL
jgi:hypothetical protein